MLTSVPRRPNPSAHIGAQSPFALILSTLSVCPLAVQGLGKPVALPRENHNMAVVNKPVNKCRSQAVVAKDGVPLRELQV